MPNIAPELLPARLKTLAGIERVRPALADQPAYLVGGTVRDLLLGSDRSDIDVVIEGDVTPGAQRLGGTVRSHERFGTASIRVNGLTVDLASARAETYPRPGALPEVRPASLADDLARRDFTVNAMAWPLAGGELIDRHGGLEDLRGGLLRVLHERSFEDDPTRAFRAARYAGRYGFELEPHTAELLRRADPTTVSSERITAELRKLAAERWPRRGFELLAEWGLLDHAPDGALIDEVVRVLESPDWSQIAERTDAVLAAVTGYGSEAITRLVEANPARPSEAVALAHGRSGTELVLARAQGAEWLDPYVREWRRVRLEIDGRDLLDADVPQGPAVGRGLRAALDAKLDGEVTDRDAELARALAVARGEEAAGNR
jgi:tRNA nucleotidyltransferase (CCA-adding enzyme)